MRSFLARYAIRGGTDIMLGATGDEAIITDQTGAISVGQFFAWCSASFEGLHGAVTLLVAPNSLALGIRPMYLFYL